VGPRAGLNAMPGRKKSSDFYVHQNYCEICYFGSVVQMPPGRVSARVGRDVSTVPSFKAFTAVVIQVRSSGL
jgi:hypothetical protein